ncbi:hypothetical protein EDC04DRAFT_2604802 [Pisolithus marmoratus]|nr:hypothetical protein EDC04DRAFT_2604802 [Pisolithus marmoratus]
MAFHAVVEELQILYTRNTNELSYYTGYKPHKYWASKLYPALLSLPLTLPKQKIYPSLDNSFRLITLSLELPEDILVQKDNFDGVGKTKEEEEESKNVWMKGHADIGSVTILWSQPVGGLQILSPDGKWGWVQHIDNVLVINTGDMMEFLTGGFYKSTIHHVIQPPNDNVRLLPLAHSPVLQRVGIQRCFSDEDTLHLDVWRRERTISYGWTELKKGTDDNTEEEVLSGIVAKHYN